MLSPFEEIQILTSNFLAGRITEIEYRNRLIRLIEDTKGEELRILAERIE